MLDLVGVYCAPIPLFALAWWAAGDHPWLRFGFSALAGGLSLAWFWWRFGNRFLVFFRKTGAGQG